jgi:dolichyl-phosphate-mannose-protein mannosyltransferase
MIREASSDTPMVGVASIPPAPTRPAGPLQWLVPRPLTDRWRSWAVTLGLTLVAGLVRLWNLDLPTDRGTPVFDEKHYAPQAWQMLHNGGVEDNAGYELVVHPPLGKQLIALGELLMGYNAWGWRLSAALAGTVCVLLIVRIVRRMTRSTLLGGIAGVLLIADGVSHVQSRIGMLDVFLATFVLAAFGCLVIDREQMHARLAAVVREGRVTDTDFGPRFGVRWWRFGAGVLLGLACATKWSGVYFIVAFATMNLVWDACARRGAGVRRPWAGAVARDLGPASWAMALVPVGAYLAAWWAWLRSETGIDRHAVGDQIGADNLFSFVPGALRAALPRGTVHPGQAPPVGVQTVELADGASADALLLRLRCRCPWLRTRRLRGHRDAHRHTCTVVGRTTGAGLGAVAGVQRTGLALRGSADRLRGRLAALVVQHSPADVLLLHDAGGAVSGHRGDTGVGRGTRPGSRRRRATGYGAAGGLAVHRSCGGQLHLALADPHRRLDHSGALEGRTLATLLALNRPLLVRPAGSCCPRP